MFKDNKDRYKILRVTDDFWQEKTYSSESAFLIDANRPRKFALLVGPNEYYDPSFHSLNYSANDMASLHQILVDPNRGAYDRDGTMLLIDGNHRDQLPTRNNIISRVASLAGIAGDEDTILFAFSGHGLEEGGESYLVPADAKPGVLKQTAIDVGWIKTTFAASRAKATIIVIDACHAGMLKGKAGSGAMTERFSEEINDIANGFAVLSSCKLREFSYEWEEKRHGVFSYYLCEGLWGSADENSDGEITVSEASNYVTRKVREWAFRNSHQQNPNLEYRVSGDIILAHVPPVAAEAQNIKPFATAADETSTQLTVEVAKTLLAGRKKIELRDFFNTKLEAVMTELASSRFDTHGQPPSKGDFQKRIHDYEEVCREFKAVVATLSYYDDGDNRYLLTRGVERLLQFPRSDGLTVLIELQAYPAQLITYASGIAGLAAKNFGNLGAVLWEANYRDEWLNKKMPAIYRANSYGPFMTTSKWIPRENAEREHTPVSNYLLDLLSPTLRKYLPGNAEYEGTFDIFEYIVALCYTDFELSKDWTPIGRFGWKYRISGWDNSPIGDFLQTQVGRGERGGMVSASFFSGQPKRLEDAMEKTRVILGALTTGWG